MSLYHSDEFRVFVKTELYKSVGCKAICLYRNLLDIGSDTNNIVYCSLDSLYEETNISKSSLKENITLLNTKGFISFEENSIGKGIYSINVKLPNEILGS